MKFLSFRHNQPARAFLRGVKPSLGTAVVLGAQLLLALSSLSTHAVGQNFEHPGQVFFNDRWGSPEDTAKAGYVSYGRRLLPAKMQSKLRGWELEDRKDGESTSGYSGKTKHYQLRTNVPRHIVELEIKPFLDALYETYVETFRERFGLEGKGTNFKSVRIYNGFLDYHEKTQCRRDNPGYIVNFSDLHMLYEDAEAGQFYKTAFHEGAHQFFGGLMPGAALPTWLSEALATYFEACTYSRATHKITFGSVPADRLQFAKMQLAREHNPDPEAMFMRVQQPQYTALHYALGWSYLHYLIHTEQGRYGKRMGALLKELNGSGNKPFSKVFLEVYGEDLAKVSRGWKAHVMGLEDPVERRRVILQVGDLPKDVDLRTGDMLARLDGVEIWDPTQYQQVWTALQEKKAPFEIAILRKEPLKDFPDQHDVRELRMTIRPEQVVMAYSTAWQSRLTALSD
ncbi:MAG: DUF1570 domain-containing protein [Planctomycetota bacterium]|nr:DUF1570 domain-containing protein [Planctomycetota bacterium]